MTFPVSRKDRHQTVRRFAKELIEKTPPASKTGGVFLYDSFTDATTAPSLRPLPASFDIGVAAHTGGP